MDSQKVKNVMTNLVVVVHPDDSIHQVARRLIRNKIGGAPVVRDGKVLGVVSEIDITQALMSPAGQRPSERAYFLPSALGEMPSEQHGDRTAIEIMSAPAVTIGPEENLFMAARQLERQGIKRLPVVDGEGYLLGIVSRRDLVRAMTSEDPDLGVGEILASPGL